MNTFERGLGPRRESLAEKELRERHELEEAQRPSAAELEAQAAEASRAYLGGNYSVASDRIWARRG
jgi:hypothetical protein